VNKAFTLIELLAVIAILAIILLIAVPMVLNTVASAKQAAFKDNAQMVIKAVDLKTASDSSFDYRTLTAGNIDDLGIDNSNYSSLSVTKQYGKTKVTIVGQGSWNGLVAYGTTDAMYAVSTSSFADFFDKSGANPPELSSNMIPVYYDGVVWRKADVNNLKGIYQWYDYDSKQWANAVTVTDAKRSEYQQAEVGKIIDNQYVLTYMVWIPKYSYYITTGGTSTPSEIQIKFEKANDTKSTGNATSTYKTHPAFTFGTQELSGFWVSKFEVTNTINAINSKPSETAVVQQTVSSFFTAIRNMEKSGNIYGYIPDEVDTHLIKNNEWGAIAYLTYSKYGKNGSVWNNNDNTGHTGCAGNTDEATSNAGCINAYNTTLGMNASTTGNLYGVYGMSGGVFEYVMGVYKHYAGSTATSTSGFSGYNYGDGTTAIGIPFPESRYYDEFTTAITTTACSGVICYGQALSETYTWNSDLDYFIYDNNPWMLRGGAFGFNPAVQGIFHYFYTSGAAFFDVSTRMVQIET